MSKDQRSRSSGRSVRTGRERGRGRGRGLARTLLAAGLLGSAALAAAAAVGGGKTAQAASRAELEAMDLVPPELHLAPVPADRPGLAAVAPRLPGMDLALLDVAAVPGLGLGSATPGEAIGAAAGPVLPAALRRHALRQSAIVSGLPWRSGASCADASFEAWRGRKLDVNVVFVAHNSWGDMTTCLKSGFFAGRTLLSPQIVVSLPLMPNSNAKQFAQCAAGSFDPYFQQFGTLLVQAGAGNAIIRLGWEANTGSSHAWGVDTPDQIPAYIQCFRREAAALKSTAPNLQIEWDNAKKGKLKLNVLTMNPGDDVTDLWGVHYYDSGPQKNTQAIWDQYLNRTYNGGPWGIGAWLTAAAQHGKKLGVGEWGVWDQGGGAGATDDPVYIQNMYNFFKANAASIAYENYYNCPVRHRIFPNSPYPKASSLYQQLWSAGL